MKQVEYRIFFPAVLITGRRVDGHATLLAQCRTVVPATGDCSMRNVVDAVKIALPALDDKDVRDAGHVAVQVDVVRVGYFDPINDEGIAV